MAPQTCMLCGHALGDALLVHAIPDRFERAVGIAEAGYRRVWRGCPHCGTATNIHDPAHAKAIKAVGAAYYDIDFAGGDLAGKYAKVMALPPERSDNAGRVERVLAALRRWVLPVEPVKAVDIGAGLWVFLARLSARADFALSAVAIEPDPTAAAHLRGLGGFAVEQGLFSGEDRHRDANLVTLNKVLEHVAQPVELLRAVARVLDPARGLAYVEVPDVATIGNRPPDDNILGALHVHLYSPTGLALALTRAGLEPLEIGRVVEPSGKITVFAFAALRPLVDRHAMR
ncbi:methyltransferase domain-containing protein [Rhabdaerophilum calidifontis]|uniref:methyltransferase domain-containing protein n=1 Tax=Rhabdaerophilum calidifontis TaxID=2604328 RepID=UPI001238E18C|nr:methyltransferase domain-containing protein [Rhabdaerophilum calidifontis]